MSHEENVENRQADMRGMQVTLMAADQTMNTLWLPKQPEGRFQFLIGKSEEMYDFFHIEGEKGRWVVYCKENACFKNTSVQNLRRMELAHRQFLVINHYQQDYVLYTEEQDAYSNIYYNYAVSTTDRIHIGRTPENDIQYAVSCVSGIHATLWWNRNRWMITDHDSLNGTYVNQSKVHEAAVYPGDVIYIVGLRIIIGFDFLSVNAEGRDVFFNTHKLQLMENRSSYGGSVEHDHGSEETEFFNRPPRRRLPMSFQPIEVEAPPMSMKSGQIPLFLRMGSSAVMGGTALAAGHVTMLLSSFLFPLLSNGYSDKERKDYEERRKVSYTKYLAEKELEIEREREEEQRVLNGNYPLLNVIMNDVTYGRHLWERQKTDDDFLTLRVGTGQLPLQAALHYPEKRFDMDEDPLEMQMYRLVEKPVYLEDAPILTSFLEDHVCGILGDHELTMSFVQNLVMQITSLHSYDDVKIVFLTDSQELTQLSFIRYLPHIWNDQRNFRFLATDVSEAYQISEYLKRELEEDIKKPRKLDEILKQRPYYVIFALDKRIFDSMEILKSVLQEEANIGVTILSRFDDLPKESTKIFQLNKNGGHNIVYLKQLERKNDCFWLDDCDEMKKAQCIKHLANTKLSIAAQNYALPKMITFLEMFGVGRIEHLNIRDRWKRNNPVKSLATPVGIGTDGTVFMLDLHEKFQGPHGLIAGMTGSGKSEFIITYILSLAINYHPDEVAFILIDYKGGGLAGAFEDATKGIRLPHLMGTITNLDGSAIQRSLLSIQSELTRRQLVFNEAKRAVGEGTMDIYAYQKLYRAGKVSEPLPHLFIISDEFAELKQQQPEFMDQLISAARIGRSLGIHLILATQKPNGVVNDQIRSNTKFRVCLRVQDKADSMDMLKRPEAAELTDTGRFYLQVGYNEYFALGQSAWCGAQYEPQDEVIKKKNDAISVLDDLGQVVLRVAPEAVKADSGKKQIVAIVQYLSALAREEGLPVRSLWTEPLPDRLALSTDMSETEDGIYACLGQVDDPEKQQQFPLLMDFGRCQNLLIAGDGGSGKTTLIQSMLYSLCSRYSSDRFQFYALDYSSRMLKLFGTLPHCGGVLTEDNNNSLDHFFGIINSIIEERKKLFSEWEVDSFETASQQHALPLILVVIDGIAGLDASKTGESHKYKLKSYLREGVNYGVKYVISCAHQNEISSRVSQEIGDRLCLHQKDKYDYSDVLGCKASYIPPEKPGRGLCKWDGRPLEFHAAMYQPDKSEQERLQMLKQELAGLTEKNADCSVARRLPVISETATFAEFVEQFKYGRIPLGYATQESKPVALPLKQLSILHIYMGNPDGVEPIKQNFLLAVRRERMQLLIVRQLKDSAFDEAISDTNGPTQVELIDAEQQQLAQLQNRLMSLINERVAAVNAYCADNGLNVNDKEDMEKALAFIRRSTSPVCLMIESLADFCTQQDMMTMMMMDAIFKTAYRYNVYMITFSVPDDDQRTADNLLYTSLCIDKDAILFGGQFDRQRLCVIPTQSAAVNKVIQYNVGIIKYRSDYHPLLMPCGEIVYDEISEDDMSIF